MTADAARAQFIRYVIAGIVNTALTYALLIVAMRWMGHLAAYGIVYVLGVALGYWLQSRCVFRVRIGWRTAAGISLVYVAQYGFGVVLLWLLVDVGHRERELAALVVVTATVPVGFFLSRLLFKLRGSTSAR